MAPAQPDQVSELLSWLKDTLEAGKGFAIEQAPALFHEVVRYGILSNALELVVWSIVLIMSIKRLTRLPIDIKWMAETEKSTYDELPRGSGARIVFHVIAALATIAGSIASLVSAQMLIMAVFAPRLYVLRWITQIL